MCALCVLPRAGLTVFTRNAGHVIGYRSAKECASVLGNWSRDALVALEAVNDEAIVIASRLGCGRLTHLQSDDGVLGSVGHMG